jgi:undecaprenyl-diphosphatase
MARKDIDPVEETAEALLDADSAVAEAVEPYRRTAAVRALAWLSELGDQPQMRMLCGAVIAAGLVGRSKRLTRAGLRMIAAHTLATEAKNVVKRRIDRSRPRSRTDGIGHKPRPGRNTAKEETSFPSGHSAGAAAVAAAYARDFPEHRAAAAAGAGAIALAQIPRCAHYPTDVGAGLALGLAAEALLDPVLDPLFDWLQLSGDEPDE